MSPRVPFDLLLLIGCTLFAFLGGDRRRIREPWAKKVFYICAGVGGAIAIVGLAWDLAWFRLGSEASQRLDSCLALVAGTLLGLLLALILSGQLLGKPRVECALP